MASKPILKIDEDLVFDKFGRADVCPVKAAAVAVVSYGTIPITLEYKGKRYAAKLSHFAYASHISCPKLASSPL